MSKKRGTDGEDVPQAEAPKDASGGLQALIDQWINEVQLFDVDDLVIEDSNPMNHSEEQIAQIMQSIRMFGWTMPLAVRIGDRPIVAAGHGRLEAGKRLGLRRVPGVRKHWTPELLAAYKIADNQLARNSEWNVPVMRAMLRQLSKDAMDLTFLSEKDLQRIFKGEEPPEDFEEKDENIPVQHCCPKCGYRWSGSPA